MGQRLFVVIIGVRKMGLNEDKKTLLPFRKLLQKLLRTFTDGNISKSLVVSQEETKRMVRLMPGEFAICKEMERDMKKILFILRCDPHDRMCIPRRSGEQRGLTRPEKWQDANISHYSYELTISCFVFSPDMPLVIEVQNGEAVSMTYKLGKEIDAANMELFQRYDTIDKVFAELEKAQSEGQKESRSRTTKPMASPHRSPSIMPKWQQTTNSICQFRISKCCRKISLVEFHPLQVE